MKWKQLNMYVIVSSIVNDFLAVNSCKKCSIYTYSINGTDMYKNNFNWMIILNLKFDLKVITTKCNNNKKKRKCVKFYQLNLFKKYCKMVF